MKKQNKRRINLDAILEIIKKYKTPLNRGNQTSKEYLRSLFDNYIYDLKSALPYNLNRLYGEIMSNKIESKIQIIKNLCDEIIEIFELYEEGQQSKAAMVSFDSFNRIKPYLMMKYTGAWQKEWFYRIRIYDERKPFSLERKELFHVPLSKKELCATERYSMPGYPCLYLATQPELCWYECKKPKVFAISKFDIPQEIENTMCLVDFSEKMIPLAHSFFCWRYNEKEEKEIEKIENYLCKFLIIYPLRAACSLIASYDSHVSFKEEYIIPQLLLQWINSDTDFDGVKYETVSEYNESHCYGGANVVFVSKGFDKDGYARNLKNKIKVATPKIIDIDNLNLPDWMISGKTEEQCIFGWGMEKGPEDYELI